MFYYIFRLKIVLEANEPEKDDVIQIYSPLHKTSSVSFRLTNRFKSHADFKAYFTYDSDPEFSVIPKEGTLEPYGKEGSTFIISFTPVEYGKNKYGKLIIETDEIYW